MSASTENEPKYDVFLSHSTADKVAVEAIAGRLRAAGLNPFLDKWHLTPGMPWQKELSEAVEQSGCAAVFVGASGIGPWQNEEMQVALNRAVRTCQDYRVIPVILPEADESQLTVFLKSRTWVDFRFGLDDEANFERLAAAIEGKPLTEAKFELPGEPAPYRGLERFESEQAEFFFGRDNEIRRLICRLADERFVAVVGASGCGKSSLVRAGLSSDVAQTHKPGIKNWRRITLVPGSDPLRALAIGLVAHLPEAERRGLVNGYIQDFQDKPEGLITALETLFPDPSSVTILLIIDQFEELFTHRSAGYSSSAGQLRCGGNTSPIQAFAANLRTAHEANAQWLRIVVTVRADFIDRFVNDPFGDYCSLMEGHQLWLGEMSDEDLREAIICPAQRCGAFFEKGLVERILRDMRDQSAALPLLEEALESLWRHRRGPWLTSDAYLDKEKVGGVGVALASKADRILHSLEEDESLVRHIFVELVQLGEGARDTRRRIVLDDLLPAHTDPAHFRSVLDKFIHKEARLISLSKHGDAETAELTHEALIDHWDRLRSWLDEGRDDVRLHRRLAEATRHWKTQGRADGLLWRPPDLNLARQFVGRAGGMMTELQCEFYDRSNQADRERRQQKIRQQRTLISILCAAIVSALIACGFWYRASNLARISSSGKLAAIAQRQLAFDPELSILLAAEAARLEKTAQAENALRWGLLMSHVERVLQHPSEVTFASTSPDGNTIVTSCEDGSVRCWDLHTGEVRKHLRPGDGYPIQSVKYSLDGQLVVAVGRNELHVWKTDTWAHSQTLSETSGEYTNAVFSPTARFLTCVVETQLRKPIGSQVQRSVLVWDTRNWERVHQSPWTSEFVSDCVFSPDDELFVAPSSDNLQGGSPRPATAEIWRTANVPWEKTDKPISVSLGVSVGRASRPMFERLSHAAFSPDGKLLVTISGNHRLRPWNTESWEEFSESTIVGASRDMLVDPKKVHRQIIQSKLLREANGVSFSPSGSFVVTPSDDGITRLWSAGASTVDNLMQHVATLIGTAKWVSEVSFSRDENWVVAPSANRALVWETTSGGLAAELIGHTGPPRSAHFTPDGNRIVTAGDTTVRIWRASKMSQGVATVPKSSSDVKIGPKGKIILADGRVWSLDTLQELANVPGNSVFNADGQLVAHVVLPLLGLKAETQILETRTGKILQSITPKGHVATCVAFSPTGNNMVQGTKDGTILIHSVSMESQPKIRQIRSLSPTGGEVSRMKFSTNGKLLATIDKNGKLSMRSTSKWRQVFEADAGVTDVLFSPQSKFAVGWSRGKPLMVWDTSTWQLLGEFDFDRKFMSVAFDGSDSLMVLIHNERVEIRDTATWQVPELPTPLRSYPVTGATFDPLGHFLLTAGGKDVSFWDIENWTLITTLPAHQSDVNSAEFDPSGRFVITRSSNKIVQIFPREMFERMDELLKLVPQRVTRDLSAEERMDYTR